MVNRKQLIRGLLVLSGSFAPCLLTVTASQAQKTAPPAPIVKDEGGPTQITGSGNWTSLDVGLEYDNPVVVLLDQGGVYAKRDASFAASSQGQVFGQFTSPFKAPPFSYAIDLPATPQGTLYDVDQNGRSDTGVQIWTVEAVNNATDQPKEPYLLPLEQPLTLTPVSSVVTRPPLLGSVREILSGKLLVYAPENGQGFPAGFGEDGKLFTPDDPIVTLPKGYTVVTLEKSGFTFDRSRQATINLIERPAKTKSDFSKLGYVEAFNALIDELKQRYAYTELRQINWEAQRQKYLPAVQAAAKKKDGYAFFVALNTLGGSLRDGHVQVVSQQAMNDPITGELATGSQAKFSASLGFEAVELPDKRVLVKTVAPGSPAAKAGIRPLAQIEAIGGELVAQRIDRFTATSNQPTPDTRRLQGVLRTTRFPVGARVALQYRNPGQSSRSITLVAQRISSLDQRYYRMFFNPGNNVSYRRLRSPQQRTYGYITWTDFLNAKTTLNDFTRFIQLANQFRMPGIVIDMRVNNGGSGSLMLLLLSYLWSEKQPLLLDRAVSQSYDPSMNQFITSPFFEVPPVFPVYAPSPSLYYSGEVVVLIGENCASACEFFSDVVQRYGRGRLMGVRSTGGFGGAIQTVSLPAGIEFVYTYTRELDLKGTPYIEARGVQPDLLVPITESFVKAEAEDRDPLLDAAMTYLDKRVGAQGGSDRR